MKAIVKYALGKEGMGLMDVPVPVPTEGELLVKVIAAGICGSDIHSMLDERETVMPVTLGHEYVGEVVETCGDVGDFKVGDKVVTLPACYSCGECEFCREGMITLCPERKSIGSHRNGAMAEYVVVPAKYSFKVPEDTDDVISFALSEPFGCAVRGVYERIDVKPDDVVVVVGPGTIGQFALQALKTRGAYVIVSGLPSDADRLALAKEFGADVVVDNFEDLQAEVKKKNPRGADIVVEAAGHPACMDIALKIIRTKGTLLVLSFYGGVDVTMRFDYTHWKELTVYGSNSTAMSSWDIALKLIAEKKVNLSPLVGLKLPLSEWKRGFEAVINKEAYKVVFCPDLDKE